MDMHPAQFGAAMQLGKHLARIEQQLGIERAFHPLLVRKIDREAQVVSFGAPEQLAAVEALFAAS